MANIGATELWKELIKIQKARRDIENAEKERWDKVIPKLRQEHDHPDRKGKLPTIINCP